MERYTTDDFKVGMPCFVSIDGLIVTLECLKCKKHFRRERYEYAKGLKKGRTEFFCSKECRNIYTNEKRFGTRECPVCNKKLKGGQRYCSEECKVKRREEKKLKRRKEKLIKCEECEALFYPVNSNIKYCSMECKNKAHSSRMTGLNNSNYKTGENYKSEFIKIREKIKARDNFKCRYCMCEEEIITYLSKGEEKKKSNLVIHHIDENKHNNSESNLLTLCASCHITLHKTKKK